MAVCGQIVALISVTAVMTAIATKFSALVSESRNIQLATISAGCFWGVEHIYRKHFKDKGLIDTSVGYTGGNTTNPTYKEVCTSSTKHAEGLQIAFDSSRLSYEALIDFFFCIHDPTTPDRQGPDIGTQYRSAIFTHNEEQRKVAEAVKDRFQRTFWKDKIITEIIPIENWWDAEAYHQKYLEVNKGGYECPTHFVRTEPQL